MNAASDYELLNAVHADRIEAARLRELAKAWPEAALELHRQAAVLDERAALLEHVMHIAGLLATTHDGDLIAA